MKRTSLAVAAALSLTIAVSPAAAQGVQGYIAGAYVSPMGTANDYFTGGFNFSGGAIFHPVPSRPFGIRLDFGYNEMGVASGVLSRAQQLGFQVDNGRMSVGSITVDALWHFGHPGHFGGFVGLGVGGYRRYVELTNTVVIPGYICDPWWGWCYPGLVPGDVVTANDTVTKFGYNASVGMTFPVGAGEMYLEARYHYMITDPATEFLPFLIGYRF
jgi:hypothetical protein